MLICTGGSFRFAVSNRRLLHLDSTQEKQMHIPATSPSMFLLSPTSSLASLVLPPETSLLLSEKLTPPSAAIPQQIPPGAPGETLPGKGEIHPLAHDIDSPLPLPPPAALESPPLPLGCPPLVAASSGDGSDKKLASKRRDKEKKKKTSKTEQNSSVEMSSSDKKTRRKRRKDREDPPSDMRSARKKARAKG